MRLASVEHQYEAIKDDGPDLKEFSNSRPLQSNNGFLHTDQYRARQLDYKIGMIQTGNKHIVKMNVHLFLKLYLKRN